MSEHRSNWQQKQQRYYTDWILRFSCWINSTRSYSLRQISQWWHRSTASLTWSDLSRIQYFSLHRPEAKPHVNAPFSFSCFLLSSKCFLTPVTSPVHAVMLFNQFNSFSLLHVCHLVTAVYVAICSLTDFFQVDPTVWQSWANYRHKCNTITNYFGIRGQITNYVILITSITNYM